MNWLQQQEKVDFEIHELIKGLVRVVGIASPDQVRDALNWNLLSLRFFFVRSSLPR